VIEADVTGSITGRHAHASPREVQISRGHSGQFGVTASINGVATPMVIDTGASSVVLTYETAKAAGLPLELLDYDVDLETASGRTKGARLTLARLAIGKLVEHSVPAIVCCCAGIPSACPGKVGTGFPKRTCAIKDFRPQPFPRPAP
jgi:aspartyl protease family protein